MSDALEQKKMSVPNDWGCETLADCTTNGQISYGIVQPGQHQDNGIPVIRVNNFGVNGFDLAEVLRVSPEIESKYERTRLVGGEVLLTLVGSTGQSGVVPPEMAGWNVPRAIAVIRPKKEVGSNWINICLQSSRVKHFLEVRANTTAQKTLNLKDVREIPIFLPPPLVKQGIESVAIALERRIELNRQINRTLEQIAQAIFKSWFVDFEPVKAKQHMRTLGGNDEQTERAAQAVIAGAVNLDVITTATDLGALDRQLGEALSEKLAHQIDAQRERLAATTSHFPDQFGESELGRIPVGWTPTATIESLVQLLYGKALKKADRKPGVFSVYGSGGVIGSHDECLVDGPGIIIGRKGTVGSLCWEDDPFFPIDTVFYVKTIGNVPLTFIYYLLQTLGLDEMNTDAAVPGLNRNNVYRLGVPNYPEILMARFNLIVEELLKQKRCNRREAAILSSLRDALLPKLLSGEIKIHDHNNTSAA